MKLHALESALQEVAPFPRPDVQLEQYPTSAHLAARMAITAAGFGDLGPGVCAVADLGTGPGVLAIAAAILETESVLAVEIDPSAAALCMSNARQVLLEDSDSEDIIHGLDIIIADVCTLGPRWDNSVDTVIMNPPFGTRTRGIDMDFLRIALRMATKAVYSLHKSTTREHVSKTAKGYGAAKAEVLAQLRFDIPQVHGFHKKRSADIKVDFWRFEK